MKPAGDSLGYRPVALVGTAVLAVVVAGFVFSSRFWPSAPDPITSEQGDDALAMEGVSLVKPPPPSQGYVGSESCRECHEEIYQQYSVSPMGRSLATVEQAERVERRTEAVVHPAGPRQYLVTRDDSRLVHAETMEDTEGNTIYTQTEQMDFVLGSGRRGRSYLLYADGALYQSPLGWYTQGEAWDLSPGYDPHAHPRFSRRIGDGCLYCHSGRTNSSGATNTQFGDPVFWEVAIGCERCHGPAEQHVKFHREESIADGLQDRIVNPAHLEPERRDSVCNQCHVLGQSVVRRYGRGFFDFRPGDRLEDVFVVLESTSRSADSGMLKAVSQVEQMHASKCYRASEGALGCVTCHDPHTTPESSKRDEFYRQRCFRCHESDGCAEPLAIRGSAPANNSCIHCHMPSLPADKVPHTSLTHHRIPRFANQVGPPQDASSDGPDQSDAEDETGLRVFGDGEDRLPQAEIDRAKGIALMTSAWQRQDRNRADVALMRLLNVLQYVERPLHEQLAVVDDVRLLNELGSGYFLLEQPDYALICWQRVLQLDPDDETALLGLAKLASQRRDLVKFREYLDRLVLVSPRSEDLWSMRMELGVFSGDTSEVIDAGERLLKLNPTLRDPRRILATAYRRAGNVERADYHESILDRITAAMREKS